MYLKIKELRVSKNISQKEIATEIGVSLKSYSDYENQKQDIPLSKLIKIAEFLRCDVKELFFVSNISHIEKEKNVVQEPTPTYTLNQRDILTAKEEVIKSLKRENELLREMLEERKSKQG